ncbi:energy transducer TonB, partial [Corallococcus sp. AB018]
MRTIFIIAIEAKRRWRSQLGAALLSSICFGGLAYAGTTQAEDPAAAPTASEAAPAAAPPEPVIELPKLLHTVEAPYPAEAERAQLEANVRLRLRVDTQGVVTQAEVMEPVGHGFDEAARTAALLFRFTPAKRNGAPAPARVTYTYVFQLPGRSKAVAATPPP